MSGNSCSREEALLNTDAFYDFLSINETYFSVTYWFLCFSWLFNPFLDLFWAKIWENLAKIDVFSFSEKMNQDIIIEATKSSIFFWVDCIWKCCPQFFTSNYYFWPRGGVSVVLNTLYSPPSFYLCRKVLRATPSSNKFCVETVKAKLCVKMYLLLANPWEVAESF